MPAWRWRRRSRSTSRPSAAAAARSRCCGGRARRCSIRISRSAPRTRTARACSTSRWPAGTPTATSVPVLAAPRFRAARTAALAEDGKSVTWKLKKGVNWHDGKPFTADDCRLQLGIRHGPGDRRGRPSAATRTSRSRRSTTTRSGSMFDKPTPFWADAFVGASGMIIPKHLFADYNGAKSREAPTNLKPVGTGPYMFVDFKPGDLVQRRDQPELPHGEPAVFRQHRDEGRRRCRVGGARRAADRRIRLRLEHAGRGRDPAAPGEGRQGQGRRSRRAATSSISSSTAPIRGPRSTASGPASRRSIRS